MILVICWLNQDPSRYSTDYWVYMGPSMTVRPLVGCHCTCTLINWSVLRQFLGDLKSYQQEPNESLQDYICGFSKQCNSLPDVIDADIVSAFLSGTTSKSLIHKLNCVKPVCNGVNCGATTSEANHWDTCSVGEAYYAGGCP